MESSEQALNEHKQDINAIDLTDLDSLTEKYLYPAYWGYITATSWNSASEIRPKNFIHFYMYNKFIKNSISNWENYSVPASEYENYICQYFNVDPLLLRQVEQYDKQKKVYSNFPNIGSLGCCKVVAAENQDDKLFLYYEYYSRADDTTVIRTGTLIVRISGDEYQYLSCKTKESGNSIF